MIPVHVDENGLIDGKASLEMEMRNDFTKVDISKLDITDESEVPGATLSVLNENGEVIETWVSGDGPHRIERLAPGKYILFEELTPHAYDQATSLPFTVLETGEVQRVRMYDEPIRITGQIDKRQEIADPTAPDTEADTSHARAQVRTSEDGIYRYRLDFRNTSSTWVDEFTVEDMLTGAEDGLAELLGITTPVVRGDRDGTLNVWYTTDRTAPDFLEDTQANATLRNDHENPWLTHESTRETLGNDGRAIDYAGWHLWAEDVDATRAHDLSVEDLGLEEGERVTGIRFEYGCVERGFTTRDGAWDRDDLKDPHDDVNDVDRIARSENDEGKVASDASEEDAGEGVDGIPHGEDGDETGAASEDDPNGAVDAEGDTETLSGAVIRMRVTGAYRDGETIVNAARVDLFRNGGGEDLEARDEDQVTQTALSRTRALAQTGTVPATIAAATVSGTAAAAYMVLTVLKHRRLGRR